MVDLTEKDQEKISKFFEYSLMTLLRGFDEMEIQKRVELVKLTGFMLNLGVQKTFFKIDEIEKRITKLEEINKKK